MDYKTKYIKYKKKYNILKNGDLIINYLLYNHPKLEINV